MKGKDGISRAIYVTATGHRAMPVHSSRQRRPIQPTTLLSTMKRLRPVGSAVIEILYLSQLGKWLVMLLEGHETYTNSKSLVDLLHLR